MRFTSSRLLFIEENNSKVAYDYNNGNNIEDGIVHKGLPFRFYRPHIDDKGQYAGKDIESQEIHQSLSFVDNATDMLKKDTVMAMPIENVSQGFMPAAPGTNAPTTKEANRIFAPSKKKSETMSILSLSSIYQKFTTQSIFCQGLWVKMKKIIFLILIFVAANLGLPHSGKASFAATVQGKVKIVTKDVDLGEIEKGKILDYKIEVKNIGSEDLTIEKAYSSCGCLEVVAAELALPIVLKPNKSTFIPVKLDTNKVHGTFERMLHVVSNDPDNKDVMWKIKGIVAAELALQHDGRASSAATQLPSNADAKIIMVFYSPGCGDCREIMEKFLPEIKEKYKDKILIVDYNVENPESLALFLDLQNKYDERSKSGLFNPKPPAVFVNNKLLYGVKEIKENVAAELALP